MDNPDVYPDVRSRKREADAENIIKEKNFFYRKYGKRILDVILVGASIPVAAPLIIVMILLVGKSPFYSQMRVGKGGVNFRIWKIRTMVPHAEKLLISYFERNPELKSEWDLYQKLVDDPRVTRVGALLRKTSLDELPQLWNVFRGDMSLVGPRPVLPDEMGLFDPEIYKKYRPGLTGIWQISVRNKARIDVRDVYDQQYDLSISLRTDFNIIIKTIAIIFRATGR